VKQEPKENGDLQPMQSNSTSTSSNLQIHATPTVTPQQSTQTGYFADPSYQQPLYYNPQIYYSTPFSQYYNYQYYSTYFTQQQSVGQQLPPGVNTTCRSLYVGNLSDRVQEPLLYEIFSALGPVESCKLIKDKATGDSSGYGFVDYYDHRTAALALQSFNGRYLYGLEIKVNWAFANGQKEDTTNHFHIFVGDISPEVDDKALHAAFSPFGTISDARVMVDPNLGKSRGYGFVAYRKKEDAQRALVEMNGEWLGTRAIRCNWANQKGAGGLEEMTLPMLPNTMDFNQVLTQAPSSNTTVYVGNITQEVSEHTLRQMFQEYGMLEEVKVQGDKGFAFVRYRTHESAAKAIVGVSSRTIGSRVVKCSWGKERVGLPTVPTILPRGT